MPETEQIIRELTAQFPDMQAIAAREELKWIRGKYRLRVINAALNKSDASGRKQLSFVCNVVTCAAPGGDSLVGATYTKNWGLEDDQNIAWLKRNLADLELPALNTAADLITIANAAIGLEFDATLVPQEGFPPNCYINVGAVVSRNVNY